MQAATPEPVLRWCPRCVRGFPPEHCRVVPLGEELAWLCGRCNGVTRAVETAEHRELLPLYREALAWPFTRDGARVVVALGVGVWVLGLLPIFGALLGSGAVAAYLLAVVRHTAEGEDDLPPPTDFIHWIDFLAPLFRCIAAVAPAALPFVAVLVLGLELPAALRGALLALAGGLGLAWVPGALANAAWSSRLVEAINPAPVLALLLRVPRDYMLTVAVLWSLALANRVVYGVCDATARSLAIVPAVPRIVATVAVLFLPLAMARVLGILLRERRVELAIDA